MKNKYFFFILLVLVGCTTQRFATTPNLALYSFKPDQAQSENFMVKVDYLGLQNRTYKFEVFIKNNSKDSVTVDPTSFYYTAVPEKKITNTSFVYSIDPQKEISKLEMQKDSLTKEKNPYSLAGMSTKEKIKKGLIEGTIAKLAGQDFNEWEEQRQEDEYNWDENHSYQLLKVKKELDFWNFDALLPQAVAPSHEISGRVLFPISLNAKELNVKVFIHHDTLNFRFAQSSVLNVR